MYKQNKTIGKEVHNITNNASYWYGIFNELRLLILIFNIFFNFSYDCIQL